MRFVVTTADPLYQDRLAHMGYMPIAAERFGTTWFRRSPDVERYFARLSANIERMILQSARLVPVPWERALQEAVTRLETTSMTWWLYGSGALAVRGIPIEPGDIDINVSDAGVAARIFDDLLVTPPFEMNGWVARHTGRAFCHAIVEWLSGPLSELDDPAAPHEQGPFIASQLEVAEWRGHQIRVPPLTAQLRVCERRGLEGRARLIRSALLDQES